MAVSFKETITVEGQEISLTNPDKLLWPESGITKLHYMQKLIVLAPYLLHYCQNRYLTTIRYPDGINGKSFYQKNIPSTAPPFVKSAKKQGVNYIVLDSLSTLLWLGNLAALEFHSSFEYVGGEEPAEWVLDIDPSVENEPRLMEAIAIIGDMLKSLGINSIPKTSGATGVQIIIPIIKGHTFEQLRKIGHFLGEFLTEKYPNLFTIERLKKNRGNKIYIDYVQHSPGKSLSAPYTPRGRKHATVSTPLYWVEVNQNVDPQIFNLLTIEERLKKHGDLIAQVEKQDLSLILKGIR
jgi:bifunctional non-homologous end joining protein LigD